MAQAFDPAAATAAYLATLPPEVHARAQAYTQGGHWLLLWSALSAVAVAWIVLRSGLLVRTRRAVERRRPRPWLAVIAVIAVDGVLELLLGLPWAVYADWWREKSYGLTKRPFGGWLGEHVLMGVVVLVALTILLSLLYALIRRAPRTWWAWGGLVTAGFFLVLMIVAPVYIEPLFNHYRPAPPGPVRDAVVALAKQTGTPSDKIYIYDGSRQSERYTANVAGLFGSARVAMSDVMFRKGADIAEVRGVVGHEMGHYRRHHIWWTVAAYGVFGLASLFLVDRLFPWVTRVTGAEGVQGVGDPAGFPILVIILTVLGLLATPLTAAFTRIAESDADRYSLEHANEPDGLSRALVKTIEYRAATPSRLEEVLFYDHPAVGRRIRRAMDWKAQHPR